MYGPPFFENFWLGIFVGLSALAIFWYPDFFLGWLQTSDESGDKNETS